MYIYGNQFTPLIESLAWEGICKNGTMCYS